MLILPHVEYFIVSRAARRYINMILSQPRSMRKKAKLAPHLLLRRRDDEA